MAERFAQCEIFAVGVDDRAGPFEAETARGRVDIIGIDLHGDHLGQKHVVRTQLKHLPHAALDAHGRLFDDRRGDLERLAGRKAHFAEFVVIAARTYAAPVRGTGQTAGREVDDELAGAADNPVGVAFGPHRDVAHRRIGADRPRPRHGQQVPVVGRIAAPHQHGRQRIDHRAGFPTLFHRPSGAACERPHGKDTLFNRNSYPAGGGTA